ncbi:hypothetical protein GQ53DRAFT_222924 [Thozetella sp. PMI_491]|nr:hypothetical protein GQ53DRAFT_222924 [Thozetella sp. PMI_491]
MSRPLTSTSARCHRQSNGLLSLHLRTRLGLRLPCTSLRLILNPSAWTVAFGAVGWDGEGNGPDSSIHYCVWMIPFCLLRLVRRLGGTDALFLFPTKIMLYTSDAPFTHRRFLFCFVFRLFLVPPAICHARSEYLESGGQRGNVYEKRSCRPYLHVYRV